MALKARYATMTDVPEAHREFYTEHDGGAVLAVEGMVSRERLDEFRNNNNSLKRERDELLAKFDGIDPEQARELAARAQRIRDKTLIDAGKVDELVNERVATMKAEGERALAAVTADRDAATKQLQGLVVDGAIRDAATKAGVRATAVDDALLRGRSVFRLVDGKAVAMDGDKPLYGKAGEPMEIAEWIGGLATTAPHLFEPSKGGGAPMNPGAAHVGAGQVARTDGASFIKNLDKIAAGDIKVV